MPEPAPSLAELEELAERAVRHLDGVEGMVTVLWERAERATRRAMFTVVVDGRAATATTRDLDDARLARAAKAAAVNARRPRAWPAPALPEPAPGPAHEGWDPEVLSWTPPERPGLRCHATAARIALASTRAVRAAEERSAVIAELHLGGRRRTITLTAAAVGPGGLDLEGLAAEAEALEIAADPRALGRPEHVVLGPAAVAALLDQLRPAFGVHLDVGGGPLAGRQGTAVAARAVHLADSPHDRATLPRSFDAEGLPRRAVPLIRSGVMEGRVHDSASAQRAQGAVSTGHATRAAALAPLPENLVLAGGEAESTDDLLAPVADGVYLPALGRAADGRHLTRGAVRIQSGRLTAPVADQTIELDPLGILESVEALTAGRRLVALPGHTPGGAGAATVPALRARLR